MKPPETWIRVKPHGSPLAVSVWVCLGGERTLIIREDGVHEVTHSWSGYGFKTRPVEESEAKGIVRIS